ncbi:ferritin subunit [Culex quinquefasciatus]|uniref:ferritin subunit n=1 Tax=Culex quinquefasciatus TaxID=7176 RepID=UPI0018E36A26|nr:ferritin subunit [Culex quinquefasciatus]
MAHQTGVELEREYVWNDLHRSCVDALHASIVYLKYAAYFAQENINLPGFEKFFFHAAGEEREHGIKLIEYALMRRKELVNKNTFQLDKVPAATTGLSALEDALKKEQEVTLSIRNLIKTCEGDKNDYHLVDYLTGEYLDEQHKGQRELAEKIATLRKMTGIDDAPKEGRKLAEFLFDKDHM